MFGVNPAHRFESQLYAEVFNVLISKFASQVKNPRARFLTCGRKMDELDVTTVHVGSKKHVTATWRASGGATSIELNSHTHM